MTKAIKIIGTLLVAAVVFAAGVWTEGNSYVEAATAFEHEISAHSADEFVIIREGEGENVTGTRKLERGDEVRVGQKGVVTIKYDENGEIRLSQNAVVAFSGLYENGYVFTLKGGRVWINDLYTASGLNLIAGGAVFIPEKAVFDVTYDGGVTNVFDVQGRVNVGLINESYRSDGVIDVRDDALINSFLISQGSQASISYNKVIQNADVLSKLLYSKLIKEFQYGLFDKAMLKNDLWMSQNIIHDEGLTTRVKNFKKEKITDRNLKYASLNSLGYQTDQILNRMGDKLTFVENKQQERLTTHIFDHILDAEYLLIYGRKLEAGERISLFGALLSEQSTKLGESFTTEMKGMMEREYHRLNYVVPGQELSEVKTALSDLLMSYALPGDLDYKMGFVRDYMNYAFLLAESDTLAARIALDQYFSKLRDLIKGVKPGDRTLVVLMEEENQIMDSLLKQYSQFYSDSVFAMKSYIETELIKLITNAESKNEEKQMIISTKIDFLKNLQAYFLARKVTLEDARAIALRLINEMRDIQIGSDVAVNELFALRLQDYGAFLRFLNTTNVATLRGASPKSKYEEFLQSQKEQVSIEQAINEFVGVIVESEVTTASIISDIQGEFTKIGIENLKLSQLGNIEQKVLGIEGGEYKGIKFSGLYDWSKKLLIEVNVGGKKINQASIRLNSLPLVLEANQNKPVEVVVVEPEVVEKPVKPAELTTEEVSKAEKVSRILFIQKLKSNGIVVEDINIVINDIDQQLYMVKSSKLTSDSTIELIFSYDNRNDVVSGLEVRGKEGIQKTEQSYKLGEIEAEAILLMKPLTE